MTRNEAKSIIKFYDEYKLSPKQIQFLAEYVKNGFQGTAAYLNTIGKNNRRLKKSVAAANATELLKLPKMREALKRYLEEHLLTVTGPLEAKIINFHLAVFGFNITDIIDVRTGKLLPNADKSKLDLITKVEIKEKRNGETYITYTLPDKMKSIEYLQKYIKMIDDRTSITIDNKVGVLVVNKESSVEDWKKKHGTIKGD